MIEEYIFPLGEGFVKLGRHHESVITGYSFEISVWEGNDMVCRIVANKRCYVERFGFDISFGKGRQYVETLAQCGMFRYG